MLTPSPGASIVEGELEAYCRERLAGYKRPKVFHIVAELPRTGIGKVARRRRRDQVVESRADKATTL